MNKEIDLVELFSGVGGFSLGFKEAGYKLKNHLYSEIDKHAIANYKYNFPDAKHIGSVKDVRGKNLGNPNVITFGSPCQDFSIAGRQDGLEGERSNLIMEAIRIVTESQPDVFIWENVKGTFSSNARQDFWAILKAFADIGQYRLEWQLLNTSWVLPQNRERIYLVGHLAERSVGKVFPFTENDRLFEKSEQAKERWSQTKLSSTLTGGIRATDTFVNVQKTAGCLTAGGNSGGLHSDMTVIEDLKPIQIIESIESNGNQPFQQNRVYDTNGISPALLCGVSGGTHRIQNDELKSNIRRLTEIENERLQGYPDDWTRYGNYNGIVKEISSTQRYKLCGNGATSEIVKAIAERLIIE